MAPPFVNSLLVSIPLRITALQTSLVAALHPQLFTEDFGTQQLMLADVWFSLNGTIYQNNSIVTLEDIGENDDALLCKTDNHNCCRYPHTGVMRTAIGNWFFPNETRVPGVGKQWDFHRDRGASVVRLYRRRGGEEGIYRCEIPDSLNVIRTIYIGVYTASTGELPLTN